MPLIGFVKALLLVADVNVTICKFLPNLDTEILRAFAIAPYILIKYISKLSSITA
jgi:hypothetical protein